jgi:hypothetical protein
MQMCSEGPEMNSGSNIGRACRALLAALPAGGILLRSFN